MLYARISEYRKVYYSSIKLPVNSDLFFTESGGKECGALTGDTDKAIDDLIAGKEEVVVGTPEK